jgi:hypothetical protein
MVDNKKLTLSQTARILGCHISNITRRLQPYGIVPGHLQKYKEARADILAFYTGMVLEYITPDKLKKSSAAQLAMIYGTLYDKERLERGQSTANIAYADLVKQEAYIDTRIKAFETKYGITLDNVDTEATKGDDGGVV